MGKVLFFWTEIPPRIPEIYLDSILAVKSFLEFSSLSEK